MVVSIIITIGIVVDDTVHFLSKYKRALELNHGNSADAVRQAFANVGPALFVTTLVLVTGFAILMQSQFFDNSTQGLLICVVLISALLLDFFMLPPLLMLFGKIKEIAGLSSSTTETQTEKQSSNVGRDDDQSLLKHQQTL